MIGQEIWHKPTAQAPPIPLPPTRQGAKFMAEGTKKLNTFKGGFSVLGSVIGGIGTWQYNTLRRDTML